MIDSFTYINHLGEKLQIGKGSFLYAEPNDLRDFTLNYDTRQNKISRFLQGIITKNLPLKIVLPAAMVEDGYTIYDFLTWLGELIDTDAPQLAYGKLVVGKYYLKCYIAGIKHTRVHLSDRYAELTLQIVTDSPKWIKENTLEFLPREHILQGTTRKNLDYSYDYSHDYYSHIENKNIRVENIGGANFKLFIFGPVNEPIIHIGEHFYSVNTLVEIGDILEIDSLAKTIILKKNDGGTVNCFSLRDKENYIFKKIPRGDNRISWSGKFGFSLTVYDERSVPEWT